LVQRVVELKERHLDEYYGNYSYYLEKRAIQVGDPVSDLAATPPKITSFKSKEQKRQEAEARQAVSQARNALQKEVDGLESRIETLEAEKKEIEEKLSLPETYKDGSLAAALQKKYGRTKKELDDSYEQWESSKLKLEALLEKLPR